MAGGRLRTGAEAPGYGMMTGPSAAVAPGRSITGAGQVLSPPVICPLYICSGVAVTSLGEVNAACASGRAHCGAAAGASPNLDSLKDP